MSIAKPNNERKTPVAFVEITGSKVKLVSGHIKLHGTLDVLHRATVEVVGTGEQFEVRRDGSGEIVFANSSIVP